MLVLIDGDTCAFAPAASTADDDPLWVATSRAERMVDGILEGTDADSFELWLTGSGNFRFNYYPEYKANRIGAIRPKWEPEVRQFLIDKFGAKLSEGCEADDMVGALQTDSTIIAHIDKDINMIPGWHFHWGLTRQGKVIHEPHKYFITPDEAIYNFYYQMLVGDSTDNIKGVPGIGPKKAKAILEGLSEQEMFEAVRDAYSNDDYMLMSGQCLWIWRKPGDIWRFPDTTISKE
jgi:DNA polymerase-1